MTDDLTRYSKAKQKQETTDTRSERRRRPALGTPAQVDTSGSSDSGRGDALFYDTILRRASSRGGGRLEVPREQWRRHWRPAHRRAGAGRLSGLGRAKNSFFSEGQSEERARCGLGWWFRSTILAEHVP